MSTKNNARLERDGRLAILTVDRPEVRNALNRETVEAMQEILRGLAAEAEASPASGAGALIVTGAGDKAFVSGADIRDLARRTSRDALAAITGGLFTAIENLPFPAIAAINGVALGGGFELALTCDLRLAAGAARFGFPETSLGIIPGAGGTQRLPRLVGLARAKHLVLTGEIIDALEAERLGLVSRVVPLADLMNAARQMAEAILARAPLAVRLAKLALNASAVAPQNAGLLIEALAQGICFGSADKAEGLAAFLEKRKPAFKGE